MSISRELWPKLLAVDDLSRIPSLIGGCKGDEGREVCERRELCRSKGRPRSANDKEFFVSAALGSAESACDRALVGLVSVCRLCSADCCSVTGVPWISGVLDCVDARGVVGPSSFRKSGGGILMGTGKRELRFLFRRGNLKKVVCVDTVCVVVVVEP